MWGLRKQPTLANEESDLRLDSVSYYYYFYNSVIVTGISLLRESTAWSPLSLNLTVLEDWKSLSGNGLGCFVNSDCCRFYVNMLGILTH